MIRLLMQLKLSRDEIILNHQIIAREPEHEPTSLDGLTDLQLVWPLSHTIRPEGF